MGVLVWHLHMDPEVEETCPRLRTWPSPQALKGAPWLQGKHSFCRLHCDTADGEQQQQHRWTVFTATTEQGTRHFYQQELAQKNLHLGAEHLSCASPPSTQLSTGGTKTREEYGSKEEAVARC